MTNIFKLQKENKELRREILELQYELRKAQGSCEKFEDIIKARDEKIKELKDKLDNALADKFPNIAYKDIASMAFIV